MKENEFKCDLCNGIFTTDWTDEEADKEYERDFPDHVGEKRASVCDDCHKKVMQWLKGQ